MSESLLLKLFVEFLGTFVFLSVILGTGEAIPIGVALVAVIFFGGKYSGGNFNPAVSFMTYLNDKLSFENMGLYVIVQLLAAACAYHFITSSNSISKN